MQIIRKLEENNFRVSHYFAGAIIPPEAPSGKNSWRKTPDFVLKKVLDRSGAKLSALQKEQQKRILMRFRKDTDFANEVFFKHSRKLSTPLTVIISKKDIFTKNYAQAEKCWSIYAENLKKVKFIDSESHYFQSDNAEELIKLLYE